MRNQIFDEFFLQDVMLSFDFFRKSSSSPRSQVNHLSTHRHHMNKTRSSSPRTPLCPPSTTTSNSPVSAMTHTPSALLHFRSFSRDWPTHNLGTHSKYIIRRWVSLGRLISPNTRFYKKMIRSSQPKTPTISLKLMVSLTRTPSGIPIQMSCSL